MSIHVWSKTALDNQTADSAINWAELQNPNTVNNSARAMMQRIAEWRDDLTAAGRVSTGAGGAYEITSASSPTALVDGFQVAFLPHMDNPGAATLKVNAFGEKPLRAKANTALEGSEIKTSVPVLAQYSSTNDEFLMIGSGHHVVATGADIAGAYNSGLRVGDIVVNLDPSPKSGRIRLGEATQAVVKADYPELDTWASERGYPWGSDSTTFNLPPAAGYVMRFAATSNSIDPDGPRTAGSVQTDQNKAHTHAPGTLAVSQDTHSHGAGTLVTGTDPGHAHGPGTLSGYTSNSGTHTHAHQRATGTANVNGSSANTTVRDNQFTTDATDPGGDHNHIVYINGGATASAGSHFHYLSGNTASYSHAHSLSGATASDGGTEARPKNVAMHADIIASPAQANVSIYATNGFSYKWSSAVAGDPGAGALLWDNADPASATALHISETDNFGSDLSGVIDVWDDGNSSPLGQLYIYKVGAPATFAIFDVASVTDSGGYRTLAVTPLANNGSFTNLDQIGVQWQRVGSKGATGSGGGGGLSYQGTWNASTNAPSLSDGSGTAGDYYIVSTAGSTSLDGVTDWDVGDWVIANATVWQKLDNSDQVLSVAGKTGAVSLVIADIASLQSSLDAKANLSGGTFTGDVTVPNLITSGNVDGRDVSADGAKLDGIASGAEVNAVDSVAGKTGVVTLADEDVAAAASATNYTPTGSTVEGHLAGIDAALGAIEPIRVWGAFNDAAAVLNSGAASYNISSTTDHGTGDYSATLTNNFSSIFFGYGGSIRATTAHDLTAFNKTDRNAVSAVGFGGNATGTPALADVYSNCVVAGTPA